MVLRMARTQQLLGDTVTVLSKPLPAFADAAAEHGVPFVAARIGGKLNLAAMARIAARIRAFEPDVVCPVHSTATLWSVRAARFARVPCVAIMQAANTPWPYNKAPATVGCAEFVRQHLIRSGMPPDRAYAVPNGIDPAAYLDVEDRASARAELGLNDEDIAVGTLAHFTPRKAHRDLLDAASSLVPRYPGMRFLWAGEGSLEGPLKEDVARRELTANVRFLGFRRDAPRLHQAFDIVVLPSLNEGLPLVLLEAMASARPCVATAVAGSPELVVDGVTGFLVPPQAPHQLADAIGKLAADPERRQAMGAAGRQRVMERFSLQTTVNQLRAILASEIRRQTAAPCA